MNSCGQHDAGSVIVEQRMSCRGKVVSISYVACDGWGNKVSEGVATVCEAHMPSWNDRRLEDHGYTLDKPREIGRIGERPLSLPDLEREH